MKQLVILSGKGGTGKTSLAAAFAHLAQESQAPVRAVLADADVDAANLGLVLRPERLETHDFTGGSLAIIDPLLCQSCGTCEQVCRFDAILPGSTTYRVDPIACEGCALCSFVCPVQAITMRRVVAGQWFVSDTRFGPLVHAKLGVAQENSGKLVTLVRNRATEIAEETGAPWLLIDGSPGIGCPVIASLAGADAVLIVTEPTLSGKSDLGRVAWLAAYFRIRALVCVNKWDINESLTSEIEAESEAGGCRIVGRIPYDDAVPRSIVQGVPLVEHDDGPASRAVRALWHQIAKG